MRSRCDLLFLVHVSADFGHGRGTELAAFAELGNEVPILQRHFTESRGLHGVAIKERLNL